MDEKIMLLRRTSLRVLGYILTDPSIPVEETLEEELSEEEMLQMIYDDLHAVICNEEGQREERAKEVIEIAWEEGRRFGFMNGMQAGARVVLSLMGEGHGPA